MEEKKKGKGSLIVIIILAITVIGLVFFILMDKGIINLNETKNNTNEKIEEKDNSHEFDAKLVGAYYLYGNYGKFISKDSGFAYAKALANTESIDACNCEYDYDEDEFVCTNESNDCLEGSYKDSDTTIFWSYDDVNATYKEIYNVSNELPKESISGFSFNTYYSKKYNGFYSMPLNWGGMSNNHYDDYYKVSNIKYEDNKAIVTVLRAYVNWEDEKYETDIIYKLILKDNSTIIVDKNDESLLDTYKDKLPVDTLTFVYVDGRYKLDNITYEISP